MFSEAVNLTIDDIHFVLGPNITNVGKPSDFGDANSPYDANDQIKNIIRMF
jgi:hypothetical protein